MTEHVPRMFSIVESMEGLRLHFLIDDKRSIVVSITENMLDLLASEIVKYRKNHPTP